MNTHNTFDAPTTVQPVDFDGCVKTTRGFDVELPPRSVVAVSVR
jgi:alpha-L-arabinofuranosidase